MQCQLLVQKLEEGEKCSRFCLIVDVIAGTSLSWVKMYAHTFFSLQAVLL